MPSYFVTTDAIPSCRSSLSMISDTVHESLRLCSSRTLHHRSFKRPVMNKRSYNFYSLRADGRCGKDQFLRYRLANANLYIVRVFDCRPCCLGALDPGLKVRHPHKREAKSCPSTPISRIYIPTTLNNNSQPNSILTHFHKPCPPSPINHFSHHGRHLHRSQPYRRDQGQHRATTQPGFDRKAYHWRH